VYANRFERRKFEPIDVCPVGKFVKTLLNVPFDDADIFEAITAKKVVHIKRTFNTRRYSFDYGVYLF